MFSLSRQQEKTHESGGVPWRALVLSLGLHALVLGALSGMLRGDAGGVAPAEPLRASLRIPAEAVVVAGEAAPAPAPFPPRQREMVAAAIPDRDAISPAPTFIQEKAVANEPVAGAVAGGIPAMPAAPRPVTVALAVPHEVPGPDAAGLRLYRLALAGEARRFRSYPEAARREGMAGTAEVRVSVGAGVQRQTELARSSGHALLDRAALDMLRAAAARTVLPESLRGQEFAVLLPVVFEVEE